MSGIYSKSPQDRRSRKKSIDPRSSQKQDAPLPVNSITEKSESAELERSRRRSSRRTSADTNPALGLLKRISAGNNSVKESEKTRTPDSRQAESRRQSRSAQLRSKSAIRSAAPEPEAAPAPSERVRSERARSEGAPSESNRSEAIRQKRGQGGSVLKPGLTSMARPMDRRHKARLGSMNSQTGARSSAGQPPVLVRRGTAGSSSEPFAGQSPRRRYDIALSIPGAEVRLPAMPTVRFGWRLASFALAAMMLGLLYMMFFTPTFQVESAQVNGLQRLTAVDVNLALGLAGESIFSVDPQMIYDRLEAAYPELAAVELSIGLPDEIILDLQERTPVIVWVQDGQERWIDADGVSFEPRGELGELVLLRVEAKGLPPEAEYVGVRHDELKLKPELVVTMLSMQAFLPEAASVVYSPERGFGWHDDRGWDAYFGQQINQMDQKLVTYQTLVNALDDQGIQPELVSVEYLHAPYYRLER